MMKFNKPINRIGSFVEKVRVKPLKEWGVILNNKFLGVICRIMLVILLAKATFHPTNRYEGFS